MKRVVVKNSSSEQRVVNGMSPQVVSLWSQGKKVQSVIDAQWMDIVDCCLFSKKGFFVGRKKQMSFGGLERMTVALSGRTNFHFHWRADFHYNQRSISSWVFGASLLTFLGGDSHEIFTGKFVLHI